MHTVRRGLNGTTGISAIVSRALIGLTLVGVLLLPVGTAFAGVGTWIASGPADTNIGTIAVAPGNNRIVYAIGQQGLWKSDGGNWSLVNSKIGSDASLAIDPRNAATLYSGRVDSLSGIVKSTDSGTHWTMLKSGAPATALAIDPARPNIVYAGIAGNGSAQILKSTDEGTTWTAITSQMIASPGVPSVTALVIDPSHSDTVFASVVLYHGGVVLRTDDGGAHWTNLDGGSQVPLMVPTTLAIMPSVNGASRVYSAWALMGSKGLLRSTDRGATWQNVTANLPAGGSQLSSLVVPGTDAMVIASIGGNDPQTNAPGGVYVSDDGGDSWAQFAPIDQDVGKLAWAPTTRTLYVGTQSGLLEYTVPDSGFPHTVNSAFRDYYDTHDGLRVLGGPISPGMSVGKYVAQYFEKGRIEDHTGESSDPNWQFMYGLLVDELQQGAVNLPVGGNASTITYATIKGQTDASQRVTLPDGFTGGTMARADGFVFIPFTTDLSPAPGHYVTPAFWDYVNHTDLFPGGWLHDIGLPITEAKGAVVNKGDIKGRQIVIQAFQRTVLTYDPLNPAEWQVERANVGSDYLRAFPNNARP